MPGKAPRRKGDEAERELAKLLGDKCTRIPISGSAGGKYAGDLEDLDLGRGEVKRRKDGFKQLYAWLEGRDWLALRADRRKWLVVLPIEKVLQLIKRGYHDGRS